MSLRRLGAGVGQLLIHAAAFAVAGYAMAQIFRGGSAVNFVAWFVGAALLHDLVFLPVYSLIDRAGRHRRRWALINYVRVPAVISGILLLVYFPPILGLTERNYVAATGHEPSAYARNWLLITAVLFAGSGLVYGIRQIRARP